MAYTANNEELAKLTNEHQKTFNEMIEAAYTLAGQWLGRNYPTTPDDPTTNLNMYDEWESFITSDCYRLYEDIARGLRAAAGKNPYLIFMAFRQAFGIKLNSFEITKFVSLVNEDFQLHVGNLTFQYTGSRSFKKFLELTPKVIELMTDLVQGELMVAVSGKQYKDSIDNARQYTFQQYLGWAEDNEADANYLKFAVDSAIRVYEIKEELNILDKMQPRPEKLDELKKKPVEYFINKLGHKKFGVALYEDAQKYIEERQAQPEEVQLVPAPLNAKENKKPDISEPIANMISPASIQAVKQALKKQLSAKNYQNTLVCYSDVDVCRIVNNFENQVLKKLSLDKKYIQYINKYPEVATKLIVGVMDVSGDLHPPLKPTGLTGLIHVAVNKKKSAGIWGGICSSAAMANAAVPLYEIDDRKFKGFDKEAVEQFISATLEGIQYVRETLPADQDIVARALKNNLAEECLYNNRPTWMQTLSAALAFEHIFNFSMMKLDWVSLRKEDMQILAANIEHIFPVVVDTLDPWENDIIQAFPGQWAGIIIGKPILPDKGDVKTSWWYKTAQIKFTKLLAFSFSALMVAQPLGTKGNFGYALKPQAELDKKTAAMIAQIVELTHVACNMLRPLYVEVELRTHASFDEEAWAGRKNSFDNNYIN